MKLQIPFGLMFVLLVVGVALWAISTLPTETPPLTKGDRVLFLTNRAWLKMEDAIIVQVTAREWSLLTNTFPKHLRGGTNTLSIFK